jgi:beta-lactamase class A
VQPAQQPVLTATPEPTQSPTPAPTPAGSSEVSAEPSKNMEELKKDLIEYIAKQDGKYGLYFINLVTGEEFGINDRDEYIAASTTKLPMNLLLYKKVESGEVDLNSKLVYLEEDFEAGTGIIQDTPYGTEYTVRETARLSIVYSDNCGINMIIRLLGIENIREYMQELGGTIYYGKRHRSCPYDLALYAQELYRFYQESPDVAGMLIEDLQNTKWNDRINKLLPAHVKVAHKIGTYPGACNDVGIVFATQPYVLAVMSDKVEYGAATNVIAELSRKIYDYVER